MSSEPDWIRDALSPARFAPYLSRAGGDLAVAIETYWWNVGISAAFYAPLHCLEMALRNAVHCRLAARFERTDWWAGAPLRSGGLQIVKNTKDKLASRDRPYTADDVVSELSFGFWVSLVSNTYHRSLWVPCLYKAFAHYGGPRRLLHGDLHTMLLFRNRIMHHEPIHHRHLAADHRTILRLLGYVSPDMVEQLTAYDQVEAVLSRRPRSASAELRGIGR
jgi:hypothetical protein